jgi:hypothetical protein
MKKADPQRLHTATFYQFHPLEHFKITKYGNGEWIVVAKG